MLNERQTADLVRSALGTSPIEIHRQTLTFSGNAIFKADLPAYQSVVLRVSPRPATFAYTARNLDALRQLGLPVQTALAAGPTAGGGSFIILNWLPGRDLMYELPTMSSEQMTRAAATISDWQRSVAILPMSRGFGWAPIGKNAGTARWTDIFGATSHAPGDDEPAADNAPPLDQLKYRLRLARKSIEPYFTTIRPVCFLDDLTIKNVLAENGELTGLIDVDFVCFGDPLMSVGTSLALLAVEVGDAGQFYGEELVRCSNPTIDQKRAIDFYAALWTIGIVSAAESAGEAERVRQLLPIAERMMRRAEGNSVTDTAKAAA